MIVKWFTKSGVLENNRFKQYIINCFNRIERDGIRLMPIDHPHALGLSPYFKCDQHNQVTTQQQGFLGFHVLKSSIRGILLSANFTAAGYQLVDKELFGPAIVMFYTSAFHCLHSFLALNGRLIIDPVNKSESSYKEIPYEAINAVFSTKKNKWTFQGKKRNHKNKWDELKGLFGKKDVGVPNSYWNLFRFWYEFKLREFEFRVKFYNEDESLYPKSLDDLFKEYESEFIDRIANLRHQAMYLSLGSDVGVLEVLMNGDSHDTSLLSRELNALSRFSTEFTLECIESLQSVVEDLTINQELTDYLFAAVFNPWFDYPATKYIPDERLKEGIDKLLRFIWPRNDR